MRESRKRLDHAMGRLFITEPFYAGILMRLKVVESPGLGTFATDGRRLLYDPAVLDDWNADELEGVLKHEATHVMALHPLRKGGRFHQAWALCCDVEVNYMVLNAPVPHGKRKTILPQGTIPGQNKLAEEVYDELDDPEGAEGGWCEVMEPEIGPGEDPQNVAREIEGIVREAAAQAKMAGKLPANIEQYLDELLKPSVDWDTVLRNFVEGFYEPFQDWSSPNRRYVHKGVILPGNAKRRTFADVALAVDVSGSMLGGELQQAVSEVHYVINECYGGDCELPVIWFDTEYNLEWVNAADELVPIGGGGTNFDAVMRCFEDEGLDQKGLIVVTDGYASVNIKPVPDVPVLWAVFGDYADEFSPPFGTVIRVDLTN